MISNASVAITTYSLPDGFFYVDAPAAQSFAANTGVEVVGRVTIQGTRDDALDLWIQSIWLTGAETLVPGEGRALVGQERLMLALGMKEKLLSAGLPIDDPHAVASVLYVVTDPGKAPITEKLGLVRFVRVDDKTTEIVWSLRATPNASVDRQTLAALVSKMLERGTAALTASGEDAKL